VRCRDERVAVVRVEKQAVRQHLASMQAFLQLSQDEQSSKGGQNDSTVTHGTPRLSADQMKELGIAVTILPGAMLRAALQALHDFAAALKADGPLAEARFAEQFRSHPLGDLHTFAGFDRIRAWEEAYLPVEELEKYEGSVGHQPSRRG